MQVASSLPQVEKTAMEMINKVAYQELREAGMAESQAQVVVAHIPDWSQFATKSDLDRLESRLIRWMVGIFVAFLGILGGLITITLNIYGVLG